MFFSNLYFWQPAKLYYWIFMFLDLEKKLDLEDGSDLEIGPSMIQDWEDIMVVG